MSSPTTIALYDRRGREFTRWVKLIINYVILAFCIWLSQGSTWWTLVTGFLFLLIFASTAFWLMQEEKNEFKSLDELQGWIDKQRAIEQVLSDHEARRNGDSRSDMRELYEMIDDLAADGAQIKLD